MERSLLACGGGKGRLAPTGLLLSAVPAFVPNLTHVRLRRVAPRRLQRGHGLDFWSITHPNGWGRWLTLARGTPRRERWQTPSRRQNRVRRRAQKRARSGNPGRQPRWPGREIV